MKQLLVIGHIWPEPSTTAAGNRMLQLLETFLRKGYAITFASVAAKTKYTHDLLKLGIKEVSIKLNHSSFDYLVTSINPEIVIFDRFMVEEQFGWRVSENCPNTIRILNTEDLHSLREYRHICIKSEKTWTVSEWLEQDKTKREIASIYRTDLSLLTSSFEKKLLEEVLKMNSNNLLMHLSFMLPSISSEKIALWPSFEERIDFISFGNGRHAPNVDSFKHLKVCIWPLIRKELPKANLHIYGAYLPQKIQEMNDPETGFLIHGWANNLEDKVQKSRVVLAPLHFGAGIKGKLIMAMQNGTPNVTTSIGVEGMVLDDSWSGFVEDKPDVFAKSAVKLYKNKVIWETAQKRGVKIVNTNFNNKLLSEALHNRIELLMSNLKQHRRANVIGNLLMHQSMAATRYMGKWIEEKSRKGE